MFKLTTPCPAVTSTRLQYTIHRRRHPSAPATNRLPSRSTARYELSHNLRNSAETVETNDVDASHADTGRTYVLRTVLYLQSSLSTSQPASPQQPFNGLFSRITWVSRYQTGETNLDFTVKARDSEWQWHQLGRMQVCTSLQTDNHASTPPLSFLRAGCISCRPTNSVKALKAASQ